MKQQRFAIAIPATERQPRRRYLTPHGGWSPDKGAMAVFHGRESAARHAHPYPKAVIVPLGRSRLDTALAIAMLACAAVAAILAAWSPWFALCAVLCAIVAALHWFGTDD